MDGPPNTDVVFFPMRNVNWNQPQVRGYPQEIAGLTKDVKGLLYTHQLSLAVFLGWVPSVHPSPPHELRTVFCQTSGVHIFLWLWEFVGDVFY